MSDRETWDFTKRGHKAAVRDVYPLVFESLYGTTTDIDWNTEYHPGDYDDELHDLDAKHGIDATTHVECGFRPSIPIYLQERWRDPDYQGFQDITITEWNKTSDTPSELGKIKADYFAYGYYDPDVDRILEAVIVDVAGIKQALISGWVEYDDTKENHRQQTMVAVEFNELDQNGIQYMHIVDGDVWKNTFCIQPNDVEETSEPSVVVAKEPVQSVFAGGNDE